MKHLSRRPNRNRPPDQLPPRNQITALADHQPQKMQCLRVIFIHFQQSPIDFLRFIQTPALVMLACGLKKLLSGHANISDGINSYSWHSNPPLPIANWQSAMRRLAENGRCTRSPITPALVLYHRAAIQSKLSVYHRPMEVRLL